MPFRCVGFYGRMPSYGWCHSRESLRELANDCSLPAALEAMGERWSFLILRGSFNGLHHFEEFSPSWASRATSWRTGLARLVDKGIFAAPARVPTIAARSNIALTDKGYALLPVMIALRQWGERWETGVPAFPVLVDARDQPPIRPCPGAESHDGRVLGKGDLLWALAEDVVREDEAAEVKAAE